jgi:hypothetical protein
MDLEARLRAFAAFARCRSFSASGLECSADDLHHPAPGCHVYAVGAYERTVAATRVALGEERFAATWAQGKAMTTEQAVEYALSATD